MRIKSTAAAEPSDPIRPPHPPVSQRQEEEAKMYAAIFFTNATAFLLVLLVTIFAFRLFYKRSKPVQVTDDLPEPPSPRSLPVIGHLHLMGGYEVPYQAFTALGIKYGNVLALKLGAVKSLVVNGQENIREVLVTKGNHFDSRPDFERYQRLFGGTKENCKYTFLLQL